MPAAINLDHVVALAKAFEDMSEPDRRFLKQAVAMLSSADFDERDRVSARLAIVRLAAKYRPVASRTAREQFATALQLGSTRWYNTGRGGQSEQISSNNSTHAVTEQNKKG